MVSCQFLNNVTFIRIDVVISECLQEDNDLLLAVVVSSRYFPTYSSTGVGGMKAFSTVTDRVRQAWWNVPVVFSLIVLETAP